MTNSESRPRQGVGKVTKQDDDGWSDLTVEYLSDMMYDMKVSSRSLVREFPKVKAAVRRGNAVEIHDSRTGESFMLTSKPSRTFGEIAAPAKGVFAGPAKLSEREGFDG